MRVSVALCCYNGEKFIASQLESLLAQSMPPDEIVICDDQSDDATISIIERFAALRPGLIRIVSNPVRLGARLNFEQAIGLCSGDLIFLCDQDDIWLPDKIASAVAVFQERADVQGVFCNGVLMQEDGTELPITMWDSLGLDASIRGSLNQHNLFTYLLLNGNIVTGATLAFRRSVRTQLLPLYLPYQTWHDHWLALCLAAMKGLYPLDQTGIQHRLHSSQQVGFTPAAADTKFWPLHQPGLKDEAGVVTNRLVQAIFQYRTFSEAITGHVPAVQPFLEQTLQELKQALRFHKRYWLQHNMPWPHRKWKLLKHWLRGGEYLDISLMDVVSI